MIESLARVEALRGQRLRVSIGACERAEGCQCGWLVRLLRGQDQQLWIPAPPGVNWQLGDTVRLGLPEHHSLKLALLLYGSPLLGLLLALLALGWFGITSDFAVLAGAVGGIALGILMAQPLSHRLVDQVQPLVLDSRPLRWHQ